MLTLQLLGPRQLEVEAPQRNRIGRTEGQVVDAENHRSQSRCIN